MEVGPISEIQEVDSEQIEEALEPTDVSVLIPASSVIAAPTEEPASFDLEIDPYRLVELGDTVNIHYENDAKKVTGTVYYRSLKLIRIQPVGMPHILVDFIVNNEGEEEIYEEEQGVTSVRIIQKRSYKTFVEQHNFHKGQLVNTFQSNGDPAQSYVITDVNVTRDSITLRDQDDESQEDEITFYNGDETEGYEGIGLDEPFAIISVRSFVEIKEEAPAEVSEDLPLLEEPVVIEEDGVDELGFIEVIEEAVVQEAAFYDQTIPDNLQKIDALNDFIHGLDPSLQKDPVAIRSVYRLIETLFYLKQSIVSYYPDGTVKGVTQVSASMLTDLLQKTTIPLGRPVLSMSKDLYDVQEEDDVEQKYNDDITFKNFEQDLTAMINFKGPTVSAMMEGSNKGVIREWSNQEIFLQSYLTPWSPLSTDEPVWRALSDSECFRSEPPALTDTIPGYRASHEADTPPAFYRVPFGLERALSTTHRKGKDRRKQVLLKEDKAMMKSYVLFPIECANALGKTRSSHLAIDSGRSQLPPQTMRMILERNKEPKELGATSNDIVLLTAMGDTLGNIPLSDYFEGMRIPALGLGDTFFVLDQYGMDHLELTPEIMNVLLEKIKMYQAQLLSALSNLRNVLSQAPVKEPTPNPFLHDPIILENIRSEPILVDAIIEYEGINLTLAKSDIGLVAYLMKTYPNYFQIAASQQPVRVAEAKLKTEHSRHIQEIMLRKIIEDNRKNAGIIPKKNTCLHVADMVSVRKIRDDAERLQLLSKVLKKYQGSREQNWINCNVCKEHLICMHERFQLQAFFYPREKATLEKETILMFSGGQFQGKFICRNCGQPLRDLEFDNNMEFDDEGRPKSGRAVLVDVDALLDEKLDLLTGVPIEPSEKKELDLLPTEIPFYNVIRELSERIGIILDHHGYRTVIQRSIEWIAQLGTREEYEAEQERLRKAGKKVGTDYDVDLARNTITTCAVFLLVEIQCKMPAYVLRYTLQLCPSPGFDGFPLDPDPAHTQGIEYMACAISSIRNHQPPWSQTGFYKTSDDAKRQRGIAIYLMNNLQEIVKINAIQSNLAEKRKYLTEIIGSSLHGKTLDSIPPSFLPQLVVLSKEEAAKDTISEEVVSSLGKKDALVTLWIRQSHSLATRTASLIKGSPLMETTCCLSPLMTPGAFWKKASEQLDLGTRTLTPNQQGNFLLTNFVPREIGGDVVEPNKDLYFRLFLKCCFIPPRTGHLHEPGLTNQCVWCGFQFPTHPKVMDTDQEGKAALQTQEVKTDSEDFIKLLDATHEVNRVSSLKEKRDIPFEAIMQELGEVEPEPFPQWTQIAERTKQDLLRLDRTADAGDIAQANMIISDAASTAQQMVQSRLSATRLQQIMEEIVQLSWVDFFKVLQNYFITPCQRLLSEFSRDSLFVPPELKQDLSALHVSDAIEPILRADMQLLLLKEQEIKKEEYAFARSKLQQYVQQLRVLLPYKNKIRPILIPGRDRSLVYFQRVFFYGPLSSLLQSSQLPKGSKTRTAVQSVADPSMRCLLEIIALSLESYLQQRMTYNDAQIKELIAIQDEKERVNVVREFNKLTDEERAVELMNKRLGLGKWAVGGTKLIYAYDKDYYDLERQKRLDAGMVDFPGLGNGEMLPPEGRMADLVGLPIHHDLDSAYGYTFDNEEDA